jgi:hypothetical protein
MSAILLVRWGETYLCLAQKGAWCSRWWLWPSPVYKLLGEPSLLVPFLEHSAK